MPSGGQFECGSFTYREEEKRKEFSTVWIQTIQTLLYLRALERHPKARIMVTAREVCSDPENDDDPMVAPQGYDIPQSVPVLKFQNKDLPMLVTHT